MIQSWQQYTQAFKRFITLGTVLVFMSAVAAPSLAFAADPSSCDPVVASPGPRQPTGPDASTYTYDSCTGLWSNQYYTWSPATKQTTPITPWTYTYNQATGKWDSSKWVYDNTKGVWRQKSFTVDAPPAGAPTIGGPQAVAATNSSNGQGGSSTNTDSSNSTGVTDSSNASVNNTIGSTAASGDASVKGNYAAGDATSGNAQALANVINMLQSSSGYGSTAATFVTNIDGDVQGDLVIDPAYLQPASASLNSDNNLDINVDNNGTITNNIDLDAASGDATVSGNYSAGNATSGNAEAIANVVNMLNSMIAAQQSFLGVININGNFNGNILMPQNFLDSLVASNVPHEDIDVSNSTLNSINANLNNTTNISNNVDSTAQSGNAAVKNNYTAGDATSGNAETNVTIFNLANEQITGSNTMLVFVNVLGKWVGVLMDAPAGATAAAYGGGVTSSTTNTANVNASNNGTITNNIQAQATSGDAKVGNNYSAGNAKSGDAETAVNLSNITNSSINLTGWFGILFINVFGNWNGNFGVKSADSPVSGGGGTPTNSQGTPQVFGFIPAGKSSTKSKSNVSNGVATGGSGSSQTSGNSTDLANVAAKVLGAQVAQPSAALHQAVKHEQNQAVIVGVVMFGGGMVLLLAEQVRGWRQKTTV